ncbi:MAG: hypothetical protein ACTSPD_07340 [Promethearchaeota archaeon]
MDINLKNKFKILFLIGLIILFISLFLDWYYLQIYNNDDQLILSWSYNPFTEWSTNNFKDNGLYSNLKPNDLSFPLIILVIFTISLFFSAFGVIFKDVEENGDLEKLFPYAYINFLVLFLNCYFIFIFPLFYLIPNNLYFPFLISEDVQFEIYFYYSVGLGYFLQIIGFICIFPYSIFYYHTIIQFEIKNSSLSKEIERIIKNAKDPLDLDKFIAEEQLKVRFNLKSNQELNSFNNIKTIMEDKY